MEVAVNIPEGLEVALDGFKVLVKGPMGELERDFYNRGTANLIRIEKSGSVLKITSKEEAKKIKAILGTIGAHINSMFKGVTDGYKYSLKVHHVHFPMTLEQQGDTIIIKNFIGQKDIRKSKILDGVKVEIKKQDITVSGIDKENVGQTAANLEIATKQCKNDPRRFQDGIYITEKAIAMND